MGLILALLGISFLIFIHELGHYLAAKKVGIRVDTFCIGFQPTIRGYRARFFAFKMGETEYVLGMVPFGGYVKMAGEEIEDEKTGSSDEFASKSVGERALVLVAGSFMNLVGGYILFVIVFATGIESNSTVIDPVKGGPAWAAGLKPGDTITEVNGVPTQEYQEAATRIILAGLDEPIKVKVERQSGESKQSLDFSINARRNESRGMPEIAISPTASSAIGAVFDDTAGSKAGLKPDDVITHWKITSGDKVYESPSGTSSSLALLLLRDIVLPKIPGGQLEISVLRDGKAQTFSAELSRGLADKNSRPVIGVSMATRVIKAIQEGSEAAKYFSVGMEITSLNGNAIHSLSSFDVLPLCQGDKNIIVGTSTGKSIEVKASDFAKWLSYEIILTPGSNRIITAKSEGKAYEAGLRAGHQLLQVGENMIAAELGELPKESTKLTLRWFDGTEIKSAEVMASASDLGIDLDNRVQLGFIANGSAAEKAGLQSGDIVNKINKKDIEAWSDLTSQVSTQHKRPWYTPWAEKFTYEARALELEITRGESKKTLEMTAIPQGDVLLGIAFKPETVLVKTGVMGAFKLGSERAWSWSWRVFLTLRSLVKGEVKPKNLSGPVGIIHVSTIVADKGFLDYLLLLAIISLNLGIFNLLPFPILDGGHLTFLGIEKIKGSPVSEQIQGYAMTFAFVCLIGLALYVTSNDIMRLIG